MCIRDRFGDGAGAVLIEPAEEGETGFIDYVHEVDGSGGVSLYMPGGGSLNPSTHETVDKNCLLYTSRKGKAPEYLPDHSQLKSPGRADKHTAELSESKMVAPTASSGIARRAITGTAEAVRRLEI